MKRIFIFLFGIACIALFNYFQVGWTSKSVIITDIVASVLLIIWLLGQKSKGLIDSRCDMDKISGFKAGDIILIKGGKNVVFKRVDYVDHPTFLQASCEEEAEAMTRCYDWKHFIGFIDGDIIKEEKSFLTKDVLWQKTKKLNKQPKSQVYWDGLDERYYEIHRDGKVVAIHFSDGSTTFFPGATRWDKIRIHFL